MTAMIAFFVFPLLVVFVLGVSSARHRRRLPPPTIEERARRAQQSEQAQASAEGERGRHQGQAGQRRNPLGGSF